MRGFKGQLKPSAFQGWSKKQASKSRVGAFQLASLVAESRFHPCCRRPCQSMPTGIFVFLALPPLQLTNNQQHPHSVYMGCSTPRSREQGTRGSNTEKRAERQTNIGTRQTAASTDSVKRLDPGKMYEYIGKLTQHWRWMESGWWNHVIGF